MSLQPVVPKLFSMVPCHRHNQVVVTAFFGKDIHDLLKQMIDVQYAVAVSIHDLGAKLYQLVIGHKVVVIFWHHWFELFKRRRIEIVVMGGVKKEDQQERFLWIAGALEFLHLLYQRLIILVSLSVVDFPVTVELFGKESAVVPASKLGGKNGSGVIAIFFEKLDWKRPDLLLVKVAEMVCI